MRITDNGDLLMEVLIYHRETFL